MGNISTRPPPSDGRSTNEEPTRNSVESQRISEEAQMLNMARIFLQGADGVPKNVPRAVQLFEDAIRVGGNARAMVNLGVLLLVGANGVPKNVPRAVQLFEDAIRVGGNASAMVNLGNILREGANGVPKNVPRAVQLFEDAIRVGGDASAMVNLGVILRKGANGVPKNGPRAVQLFEDAIRVGGDTRAMVNLGNILLVGANGVPKNVPRAVQLFEDAIRVGGGSTVMYNLGLILHEGADGVPKNVPRAVQLFEDAIRVGGDASAMYNLGLILREGANGVPENVPRAVQLFEDAIRVGGNATAMFNLGNILREGANGVPKNVPRAVQLFEDAIRVGGDTRPMVNLGVILRKGANGVPKNVPMAVQLFEDAIRVGGDTRAMVYLGVILLEGADGVPENVPRAVQLFEDAIRVGGDADAMVNLGVILREGADGVPKNVPRAVQLFEDAIRVGGNARAMVNLGVILREAANGIPKNVPRAVQLFEDAIRVEGHAGAMFNLGYILRKGADGVPKNVPRAVQLFEDAIRVGGNATAMFNLGNILREGANGVPKNVPRAVQLFEDAIRVGGDASAMVNLGVILRKGANGVPKNGPRAVQLFEDAIRVGGDTRAMVYLGVILLEGADGVPKNVPRAVQLFEDAIRVGGNARAMVNLGVILRKGANGVPKNVPKSVQLFEDAIRVGGDTRAMVYLGVILLEGADGVPKNVPRAVQLFEDAIRVGGNATAMFNLGNILREGANGVPENVPRAVQLFEDAIRVGGDASAMVNLGVTLRKGANGVPKNGPRAVQLFEDAIRVGGDTRAMVNLGNILLVGANGVPENVPRAVQLFEDAIRVGGGSTAMYQLANILRTGANDVPRNILRAINILEELTSLGQVGSISQGAMIDLARLYLSDDVGDLRNPRRGKELLKQCVDKYKDRQAMHELAVLLRTGDIGVPRDDSEAQRLFKLCRTDGRAVRKNLFKPWEKEELLAGEHHWELVEYLLKAETARPRQCGVLVVGGGGRGKTSTVRSLQGMAFVSEHVSTELADVEQIVIIPGESRATNRLASELVLNVESLTGNMTRAGGSAYLDSKELLEKTRMNYIAENPDQFPDGVQPFMQHTEDQETAQFVQTAHVTQIEFPTSTVRFPGHITPGPSSAASSSQVAVGSTDCFPEFIQRGRESFGNVINRSLRGLRTSEFPTGGSAALLHCFDLAGQEQYMMAHSLFIGAAEIVVLVVNLANIDNESRRKIEITASSRWIEMVHNSCREIDSVKLIIVGTRSDDCKNPRNAFDILFNGLKYELGKSVYDAWFGSGGAKQIHRVAIENRRATTDPRGAGLEYLETVMKEVADGIVAARDEVSMRWIALVEELEAIDAVFLEKCQVLQFVYGFQIFGEDKEKREEDVMRALRYYHRVGRLVLLELSEDTFYLFCDPSTIVNFVRQVTGPDGLIKERLEQADLIGIEKGIVTRDGLAKLWGGYSMEEQSVMLDLLCRFDLLMRIPGRDGGERCGERIAIPALLEEGVTGFKLEKRSGELELRAKTKFVDVFPSGVMNTVISNLHRTLGGEKTEAGFLRSNAAILGVNLYLQSSGRVVVASNTDHRQIEWTVRAEEPVGILRECLQALSRCLDSPLHTVRTGRHHFVLADCNAAPEGCGGKGCVTFKLPLHWISSSNSSQTLPNVLGKCLCKERWKLQKLLPMVCRNMSESSVQEAVIMYKPSMPYDAFISHAGPQKGNVAMPFLNEVKAKLRCFLDVNDIQVRPEDQSEQIYAAIRGSKVFVFIVSLEAVMRKWPIRELRKCFELRDAAEKEGRKEPIILPLFYGLSVADCKDLELLFRDEYREALQQNGFFTADRQRECPPVEIMETIKRLTKFAGVVKEERETDDEFARRSAKKLLECIASVHGALQA